LSGGTSRSESFSTRCIAAIPRAIEGERSRADIATTEVAVDGLADLWHDDRAAMDRANASPEAKRLHDDGALFIGGIKTFIIDEKVIIPISA